MEGTLKDFGISQVFQTLSRQKESGVLFLKSGRRTAEVCFRQGKIVRGTRTFGRQKELIGELLLRAQLLAPSQLAAALAQQRKTLRRLGEVLIELKVITREKLRQMVQLQTTEALYEILAWKSGSYRFEAHEVPPVPDECTPLQPEAVLSEGVKRIDAWPDVRKVVSSYQMTFSKLRELPAAGLPRDALELALDRAMAEFEGRPSTHEGDLLAVERWVYSLVTPARDVRALIDLSCMGEFDVCRALGNLVSRGYLRAYAPVGDALEIGQKYNLLDAFTRGVSFLWVSGLLLLAVGLTFSYVDPDVWQGTGEPGFKQFVAEQQLARIRAALEVYHLETGNFPESLDALQDKGLLDSQDLQYPWENTYVYRREPSGAYVLLPPLR